MKRTWILVLAPFIGLMIVALIASAGWQHSQDHLQETCQVLRAHNLTSEWC